MASESPIAAEWVRALRPHQWAKNALLFVPLALTPGLSGQPERWIAVAWAFVAWSAIASLGYLVNDWVDREADRADVAKRERPFASGRLSGTAGAVGGALLAAFGFGIALGATTPAFTVYLVAYLGTTLAYTFYVKQLLLADVLVLAGLYTLRLLAGGAAAGIELTPWLLAFSLFLFLGLAFVKRYGELRRIAEGDRDGGTTSRRDYRESDTPLVMAFGTVSAYLSVLVLCLYINEADQAGQYQRVEALWFLVPLLLYWVSRIWFLAQRGRLGGDPVAFAVRDPASLVIGAGMGLVVLVALGS